VLKSLKNLNKVLLICFIFECKAEIETSADEVSADLNSGTIVLSGKAKVSRKGVFDFLSDTIKLVYRDKKYTKPKHIEASGCVRFEHKGIIVTASKCRCDMQKVWFTGNVVITSKEIGVINSDSAVYDIDSRKIEILSRKRVTLKISNTAVKSGKKLR
jgi:lipopolysaccharide export system protein LptA